MSSVKKKNSLFTRLVPPPRLLTMPAIGLDISDESVKFVELTQGKQGVRLGTYGRMIVPKGTIVDGGVQEPKKLVELLKKLRKDCNVHYVHASLPEEHAYLFQTEVKNDIPYNQLRTAIEFKLKENVPLSPEEVVFDFMFIPNTASKTNHTVSVSVYPREIVQMYVDVIVEAGITPLSLEIEGEANARAVIDPKKQESVMIVDIGMLGTELSIVNNGIMAFTTSLEVSGDDFTKVIQKYLDVSYEEAEKAKEQRGFVKSKENNELFEGLLGTVSVLRDDINKHLAYWQMHNTGRTVGKQDVERIILTGGGANLKGLEEYLSVTMSVPVSTANVWTNISTFDDYVPPMDRMKSLSYTTAIGLALRSIGH